MVAGLGGNAVDVTLAAMCAALLIVTYVPAVSLWLPHLLAR